MEELELFTVNVFQTHQSSNDDSSDKLEQSAAFDKFQNMTSARIIKGRVLELEHSNIVGPSVKFKTVVNYERTLKQGSYLGVSCTRQDGYLS